MKTIKQIANEIGVSKQAIQKRISREPLCTSIQPYIQTIEGIKYIEVVGENLIKTAYFSKTSNQYIGVYIQDVPSNQQPVADNQSTTTNKNPVESSVEPTTNSGEYIQDVPSNQQSVADNRPTTTNKNPIESSVEPTTNSNDYSHDVYRLLENTIDTLQKQLETKDKQIASLTEVNKELIAVNKNLSESINIERKNELAETIIDGNKLLEDDKPQKRGFFSRLLRK